MLELYEPIINQIYYIKFTSIIYNAKFKKVFMDKVKHTIIKIEYNNKTLKI